MPDFFFKLLNTYLCIHFEQIMLGIRGFDFSKPFLFHNSVDYFHKNDLDIVFNWLILR